MKKALKEENIDQSKEYIIAKIQKATVSQWCAVGDNNGIYETPDNIRLKGNVPSGYNYAVETGNNVFICYGNFCATEELHGEKYKVFNVENWEIAYPVKRNSLFNFLLPKSYLCKYDML